MEDQVMCSFIVEDEIDIPYITKVLSLSIIRGVICHRNQPDRGPQIHLHAPNRVSEGPGDVHVPNTAQLG